MEFTKEFGNDDQCLLWLWKARFSEDGEHAECPKCKDVKVFARYETSQQRQSWTCTACGHHLHPTAGTIFHKSSTSLHLWFYAMYLMTSTRCGISAKQLERELGVTYKTAWRMADLIRNRLMTQDAGPFEGNEPVEIDETYVGGKYRYPGRGRHYTGRSIVHKAPVLGMVQRKGRVVAMTVKNANRANIFPHVTERVLPASTVYTDEYPVYNTLAKQGPYEHHRIPHAERIYVAGDVHTNTIEGFWSLVKRGLDGVFHSVSKRKLQGYLNEYAWRYNQRLESKGRFELLLLRSTVL
jgi:transposase-like protein